MRDTGDPHEISRARAHVRSLEHVHDVHVRCTLVLPAGAYVLR